MVDGVHIGKRLAALDQFHSGGFTQSHCHAARRDYGGFDDELGAVSDCDYRYSTVGRFVGESGALPRKGDTLPPSLPQQRTPSPSHPLITPNLPWNTVLVGLCGPSKNLLCFAGGFFLTVKIS